MKQTVQIEEKWTPHHFECDRCGIELPQGKRRGDWCADCIFVVGEAPKPRPEGSTARFSTVERARLLDEVARLVEDGLTPKQIVEELNVSRATVGRMMRSLGLTDSTRPHGPGGRGRIVVNVLHSATAMTANGGPLLSLRSEQRA